MNGIRGRNKYQFSLEPVNSNPGTVTVTSCLGGSTTGKIQDTHDLSDVLYSIFGSMKPVDKLAKVVQEQQKAIEELRQKPVWCVAFNQEGDIPHGKAKGAF